MPLEDKDTPESEAQGAADQFLFNDYFTDEDDRGVEVMIPWGGKNLPFRIKHSLTLGEKQRANDAAFKIDIDKNGKPNIAKQDQSAYTAEVVFIGLKFWPFEYQKGRPVPINRKTIAAIDGDLAAEIASRILNGTRVNTKALVPFERKSDAA